jgi:hypothetical protein
MPLTCTDEFSAHAATRPEVEQALTAARDQLRVTIH